MKTWQAPVLAVALLMFAGCDSDGTAAKSPDPAFTTPADGSVRIPQGTVEYMPGDVQVGVGGVTKDPDGAVLSVRKKDQMSVDLVLDVGEKGTAFGQTVTVTAIEFGDHDYAWVKVTPS
jgi:hypothetical protein